MNYPHQFKSLLILQLPHFRRVGSGTQVMSLIICIFMNDIQIATNMSKRASIYSILGIIFLLIYVILWIIPTGGMGNIFGLPLFVIGVMFMASNYNKNLSRPTKKQKWNYLLQLLLVCFSLLYMISIIGNFTPSQSIIGSNADNINVFDWPGMILILLLLLYAIGFSLSWKNKLAAGIIFIIWYFGLIVARLLIESNDLIFFSNTGIVVLLLGILYIYYHSSISKLE